MGRAGRKRNPNVVRERNGRAAREYQNPRRQVAEQPHRILVPVAFREFQEAESDFGRLMLNKHITPAQHEAGKEYAELAAQYRAALQCPPIHPMAIDLARVGKGRGDGMPDPAARQIRIRYDKAFIACGDAGHRAQKAVKDYAVLGKPMPSPQQLDLLKSGLDVLIKHFGIDRNLQISSRQK